MDRFHDQADGETESQGKRPLEKQILGGTCGRRIFCQLRRGQIAAALCGRLVPRGKNKGRGGG